MFPNEHPFPNLTYDAQRTEAARKEMLTTIHGPTQHRTERTEKSSIGAKLSAERHTTYSKARRNPSSAAESIGKKRLILAGQILFTGIFMLCRRSISDSFRNDYYKRKGSLSLLFRLSIAVYCVLTAIMVADNIFNIYIILYAMLPVILRVFLDSRTAFIAQATTIPICSIWVQAIRTSSSFSSFPPVGCHPQSEELSQRSQLFRTAPPRDTDLRGRLLRFRVD